MIIRQTKIYSCHIILILKLTFTSLILKNNVMLSEDVLSFENSVDQDQLAQKKSAGVYLPFFRKFAFRISRHETIVPYTVRVIMIINGPTYGNLVLIADASSEGYGMPAHMHRLARALTVRKHTADKKMKAHIK